MKKFLDSYLSDFGDLELYDEYVKQKYAESVRKLIRARKEYDATRFFVLVVGPVKSGKSTLVNCFARNYVSPTAYEECTAMPCIIAKNRNSDGMTEYFARNPEQKNAAINTIIDYLRDIASKEELETAVASNGYALTKKNVQEHLAIHHPRGTVSRIFQNPPLITVLDIKGGDFINDEIVLVDMPGLDGYYIDCFDNPEYMEVVNRADFVVFVQSTSSVVNKLSSKFLDNLYNTAGAKRPPVFLIHNVHAYDYWHPKEERCALIAEQLQSGVRGLAELIQEKDPGEIRTESINLGMVTDHIFRKDLEAFAEKDQADIESEYARFERIEKELVEYLKLRQGQIKRDNCDKQAHGAIGKHIEALCELRERIAANRKELEQDVQKMEALSQEITCYNQCDSVTLTQNIRQLTGSDPHLASWPAELAAARRNFNIKIGYRKIIYDKVSWGTPIKKELDRFVETFSKKSHASKGSLLFINTKQAFENTLKADIGTLKARIEAVLNGVGEHFAWPIFDVETYVPFVDDVFVNQDTGAGVRCPKHLRERLDVLLKNYSEDIPDRIRKLWESVDNAYKRCMQDYLTLLHKQYFVTLQKYTDKENGILTRRIACCGEDIAHLTDAIECLSAFVASHPRS